MKSAASIPRVEDSMVSMVLRGLSTVIQHNKFTQLCLPFVFRTTCETH